MDLDDWEFHQWLCDTSDHNPGEITDLMNIICSDVRINQMKFTNYGGHFWDTTGHENIECPLKFTKQPTPKTSTNAPSSRNKPQASSSRTQPSSSGTPQRTDNRDNRDLYDTPPPAPKLSRSKKPSTNPPAKGYASGGWRSVNDPEQGSDDAHHLVPASPNHAQKKPDQRDRRQDAAFMSRASDSNTSRPMTKRPAMTSERKMIVGERERELSLCKSKIPRDSRISN
ncbi:uncharacterized protein EAF01_011319 [Botrytis porri]|uniref:uncharacterized protein n=1 Tax=Botrytis porri TaxID=87229 RepID=UPI001901B850|nr:uncharacterized protein EAF01_011319 [Botrytis porri]KAF7886641.1 hypothetical protein EAF01_011319 [Botrytis porri]